MSVKVNRTLVFWALGVVQPASAFDLIGFIGSMYPDVRPLPSVGDIRKLLDIWVERSDIQRVHARSRLYSLTSRGNSRFEKRLRHQRDKLRIVLLKSARHDRFEWSGEASQGLLGVSPSIDVPDYP